MSLDGFISGPDDGPGNGLGSGGNRLPIGSANPTPSGRTSTRRG
jgi:hypothetical protein